MGRGRGEERTGDSEFSDLLARWPFPFSGLRLALGEGGTYTFFVALTLCPDEPDLDRRALDEVLMA